MPLVHAVELPANGTAPRRFFRASARIPTRVSSVFRTSATDRGENRNLPE